jgi:hypothetical protein
MTTRLCKAIGKHLPGRRCVGSGVKQHLVVTDPDIKDITQKKDPGGVLTRMG